MARGARLDKPTWLFLYEFLCCFGVVISLSVLPFSKVFPPPPAVALPPQACIARDVVLLHGLANQHPFGDLFIYTLYQRICKGSALILINLDSSSAVASQVRAFSSPLSRAPALEGTGERRFIEVGDRWAWHSGTQPLPEQSEILGAQLASLQQRGWLRARYHLIAHSLGGMVALSFVKKHPEDVESLVALGTPYKGTILFEPYAWVAALLGADKAIEALDDWVREYHSYVLPPTVTLYTVASQMLTLPKGRYGELNPGWVYIAQRYGQANDGVLVPPEAMFPRAQHVGTLLNLDHYMLVRNPMVAELIATKLWLHNPARGGAGASSEASEGAPSQ